MGVPKFFRAMLRRYPDAVQKKMPAQVDWLHLDFNGLMHPVCRGVMKQCPDLSRDDLEARMMDALCQELERMAARFEPREGLLVAIDGPAPVAKMIQQRERRFKSMVDAREARAKRIEFGCPAASHWDTNAITPGTEFLYEVSVRLEAVLRQAPADSALARVPCRVLTDGQVPGEGEHKLFQYIREQGLEGRVHTIVGLDADLIFLSMLSPADRIFLSREEEPEAWQFIDVACLRRAFWEDVGVRPEDPRGPRVIQDICLLGCLFGNDFLPTTYVFDLRHKGFLRLLEGYRTFWKTKDRTLFDAEGRIDFAALAALLKPFADEETEILADEVAQVLRRRPPPFVADSALSAAENRFRAWEHARLWTSLDPVIHRVPWRTDGWQEGYYRELFELKTPDGASLPVDEVARLRRAVAGHYVEGIVWVLHYYTGRLQDWHWFFPFHTAPLLQDLVEALQQLADWTPQFAFRGPLAPLQQLALVLPVASHAPLLPAALQRVLEGELWWLYPTQTRSRGFLRTQNWEFVPLLPPWPQDLAPLLAHLDTAGLDRDPTLALRNERHTCRTLS